MAKSTDRKVFAPLGANNHVPETRAEHDLYCTPPIAIDLLCSVEKFDGTIWECATGLGHLSQRLEYHGYTVISTDLIDRGYGQGNVDFLQQTACLGDNIITNPPYSGSTDFIYHALKLLAPGKKLAMFLKLQFLEGKARRSLFQTYPPKTVYVSSSRIMCAKNGNFNKSDSSAVAYMWAVWWKGHKSDPVIKWIN